MDKQRHSLSRPSLRPAGHMVRLARDELTHFAAGAACQRGRLTYTTVTGPDQPRWPGAAAACPLNVLFSGQAPGTRMIPTRDEARPARPSGSGLRVQQL